MTSEMAYNLGLVGTGIAFCGTVFSWFLMNKFGHLKLHVAGMMAMITALCVIGVLQVPITISYPACVGYSRRSASAGC